MALHCVLVRPRFVSSSSLQSQPRCDEQDLARCVVVGQSCRRHTTSGMYHSPVWWLEILRPQAGLTYFSATSVLRCILHVFSVFQMTTFSKAYLAIVLPFSAYHYHHGSHSLAAQFGFAWFIPRKWHTFPGNASGRCRP